MLRFIHKWRVNKARDRVIACGERLRIARNDASLRGVYGVDELERLEREHQEALERFKEVNNSVRA